MEKFICQRHHKNKGGKVFLGTRCNSTSSISLSHNAHRVHEK